MEKITLKVLLACAAAVPVFLSTAALAQGGGGTGQGGSGGGDAHGAATAGMTYHGDPATSPLNAMYVGMPGGPDRATMGTPMMSPRDTTNPDKSSQ